MLATRRAALVASALALIVTAACSHRDLTSSTGATPAVSKIVTPTDTSVTHPGTPAPPVTPPTTPIDSGNVPVYTGSVQIGGQVLLLTHVPGATPADTAILAAVPMAGATVRAVRSGTSAVIAQTTTDVAGRFVIFNLAVGSYDFTVTTPGAASRTATFQVSAHQAVVYVQLQIPAA